MFNIYFLIITLIICVSEIAIVLFSELIVLVPRQIDVTQTKSNDANNYPGYKYESGRVSSKCTVI